MQLFTPQVSACHGWTNYSCGWGDPLGTAAIDYGVANRGFIFNLSPDEDVAPDQTVMFQRVSKLPGGV
jgi:hypothetical protein